MRALVLLLLPLGEGWGEGTGRLIEHAPHPPPHALTPTLSQREREQDRATR